MGAGEQALRDAVKRALCQPHWMKPDGTICGSVEDLTTDIVHEVLTVLDGDVTHGAIGRPGR